MFLRGMRLLPPRAGMMQIGLEAMEKALIVELFRNAVTFSYWQSVQEMPRGEVVSGALVTCDSRFG